MCHAVVAGAEIEREEAKLKRDMKKIARKYVGFMFSNMFAPSFRVINVTVMYSTFQNSHSLAIST